jgi:hypothetical protein
MRSLRLVSLCTTLLSTTMLAQSTSVSHISPPLVPRSAVANGLSQPDPAMQAKVAESYGKLPLSFEANHGQADERVKFLSRTGAYTLFLTGDEAVLAFSGKRAKKPAPKGASRFEGAAVSLKRYPDTNLNPATPQSMAGGVLRMKLRNANPAAKISGTDELAGTSNYFIGNDPAKWRTSVSTYAKVKYEGIYSGIDLVYYANQRQLEHDFIVAPGADPRRISFDLSGAKRIRRDAHGDLVLKTGEGEIRWHKPVVYQEKDGTRQLVAAHYAISDRNRVGFEVASYDASRPLYIDPLIYSTYLGGSTADQGFGITVDNEGNAYVTGVTESPNFPTTPGAFQTTDTNTTFWYAFVSKINTTGSALVYSTYLGGSIYYDNHFGSSGSSIAVDGAGNAYVTGYTTTTDFPVTPGVFQTTCNVGIGCFDAFVTKLNPTGSALVYSTYLGGSGQDGGATIVADIYGNAYVTGYTESTNFPTMSPLQAANGGGSDAFVAKINPSGSALVYSTYLGGSGDDFAEGTVDSAGNVYVTGSTTSSDFPVTPGAFQTTPNGGVDTFVVKFNPTGSALIYSTYIGGSGNDAGFGIAVDSEGNSYVTGLTTSTDFPTTPGAFQTICGCQYDGDSFVFKLNPTGSALVYSTYLGATSFYGVGSRIAVGSVGNAYVVGSAACGFPTTPGAVQTTCKKNYGPPRGDAFVTKVNAAGSALVYSTYLGGGGTDSGADIAVDSVGNAYVTGFTNSPSGFPTKNPLQPTNGGQYDAFVTKIDMRAVPTITLSSSLNPSTYGQEVTLTAVVNGPPDGEAVTFKQGTTVLGTGTLSGGSASFTIPALKVGTDAITAVYSGDSNFTGSTSKAVKQVVNKATTTTTLTSSQNPSNFGQSVTFTANVTPQFSGTVKGSVTFYDGATALKTVALSGGVSKFTTSTLTSGSHSITATYNGNANFDGSSASLTQTVN